MPAYGYSFPSRRLVSQEDASTIEPARIQRTRFSGTKSRLMTFDAGYVVPFLLEEVIPGGHYHYNVQAYIRMNTPLFPLFSNQRVDTFFFFVPMRLLWENWERFMGAQDEPGASINYTVPQIVSPAGGHANHSIYDHFHLPVAGMQIAGGSTYSHSALPLRAYARIYYDWFRDQNNIAIPVMSMQTDDGPDLHSEYTTFLRAKSHDYFTSALPWAQKFTSPTTPLTGRANIVGIGTVDSAATGANQTLVRETGGTSRTYDFYKTSGNVLFDMTTNTSSYLDIFADLSTATGVSINTFRQAFAVQSLLERDARGGTRYNELLFAHWGVRAPDFRLQRPEYVGGGRSSLNITPIAQTAPDAGGGVVGALGGAGTSAGQHSASYAAVEHGYIIGLINVKSELAYQQGLHRLWSRLTRYDFPFPEFVNLGEQPILQKEIYTLGTAADDTVFGYQERYHEYRTGYSEVTGMFRSDITSTIDPWHLAQYFGSAPVLDATFINDTPPMTRVLAAGSETNNQQYLADINIERTAVLPLPMFGTPAAFGRF